MKPHVERFFSSWRWTACLAAGLFLLAGSEGTSEFRLNYAFVYVVLMYVIVQRGRIPGILCLPASATLGGLLCLARTDMNPLYSAQSLFPVLIWSCLLTLVTCFAEVCLRAKEHADANSRTDSLTGLLNRRGFEERLRLELERIERTHDPAAVVCLDGDGFKSINDRFGHYAGDHYLEEVAKILKSSVRGYDSVARWGGDEFLLLLPGCDVESTRGILQRIQEQLSAVKVGPVQGISWSAGAVVVRRRLAVERILREADERMYAAKKQNGGAGLVDELNETDSPEKACKPVLNS